MHGGKLFKEACVCEFLRVEIISNEMSKFCFCKIHSRSCENTSSLEIYRLCNITC